LYPNFEKSKKPADDCAKRRLATGFRWNDIGIDASILGQRIFSRARSKSMGHPHQLARRRISSSRRSFHRITIQPIGTVKSARLETKSWMLARLSGPIWSHYFRIARDSGKACRALISSCKQ